MMRDILRAGHARAGLAGIALIACVVGAAHVASGVAVPIKAEIAQRRLDHQFEQRLQTAHAAPAAPASTARVASRRTRARALPHDGAIARITIARLAVRDIVLAGDGTHDQLAQAPTLIRRSDDETPVTILAAHRDTHFRFIRDLREGDRLTMEWVNGAVETYRVTYLETVRWDRFAYPRDPARPLLALATCYPFGGTEYRGPWRRVAWAERV